MAKLVRQGNDWALILSSSESQSIGLKEKEFELHKAKDGLLVLVEKPADALIEKNKSSDQKIFSLLEQKELSDRVEGNFESLLAKEELVRFKELLKIGAIELFKLSPQYKKAVYQRTEFVPAKTTTPPATIPSQQPPKKKSDVALSPTEVELDAFVDAIDQHGFTIAKGEYLARQLSELLSDSIRAGEVVGIRSFDGNFYISTTEFLEIGSHKFSKFFSRQKTATLQELSEKTAIPLDGCRVLCELLKEDGDLIEKRKGIIQWIA